MDEAERRRRAAEQYGAATAAPPPGPPSGMSGPDGSRTAGGAERAPGAQKGTGYVNLQTYLGANYGAGQDMANRVAGETARQGDAERAALQSLATQGQYLGAAGGAPGMVPMELAKQAQDTAARARLAAPSGGGLGAVLAQDYGQTGPYTSGMSGFDAFLAGTAGGKTLQASGNAYGGLGWEVDAANKAAASYVPPAAPAGVSAAPAPAPAQGGAAMQPVPDPYSPLTYTPETGLEGGAPAAKRRNRQIDPASWWAKPMKGGV